jgi:hypothetical protein
MIFKLVHAPTFGAAQDMGETFVGGMSPMPTVMTLWHTRVHTGGPYCGGPASDIDPSVDKGHSLLAILRVPQVKPDMQESESLVFLAILHQQNHTFFLNFFGFLALRPTILKSKVYIIEKALWGVL